MAPNMKIGWYPGHMHKARRKLLEILPQVDALIEVVDARLPQASANPVIAEMAAGGGRGGDGGGKKPKPLLRVLNKRDLADPAITERWLETLQGAHFASLALSANRPKDVAQIPTVLRRLVPEREGKPLRAAIAGIPNVGKSTLINALAGRRIAKVGNEPAVTKGQQRILAKGDLQLIDTPGMLWPNLEDQEGAKRLATSGAIRDTVYDYQDIAIYALEWLQGAYPDLLEERFGLGLGAQAIANEEPLALLEAVGAKRGCLKKGGILDYEKAAELLVRDIRSGKLGRLSFEAPQ